MQNSTFHTRRRSLSEAQMLFCSHLWKIYFLNQMGKELSNSWLFIQVHKVNSSDHKLCFPDALMEQNSPEKYKGNTTGDRKESQCPQCPQKNSLQIQLRRHCAHLKYLYRHKDVALNDASACVYSNQQETKPHSFTFFFFFTLGGNHISLDCHPAWVITYKYVPPKWGQNK